MISLVESNLISFVKLNLISDVELNVELNLMIYVVGLNLMIYVVELNLIIYAVELNLMNYVVESPTNADLSRKINVHEVYFNSCTNMTRAVALQNSIMHNHISRAHNSADLEQYHRNNSLGTSTLDFHNGITEFYCYPSKTLEVVWSTKFFKHRSTKHANQPYDISYTFLFGEVIS